MQRVVMRGHSSEVLNVLTVRACAECWNLSGIIGALWKSEALCVCEHP